MKRTAVLFDMDGLMVDTEPLARLAWQRVADRYGALVTDDLYQRMLGRRTVESAQMVLDDLRLPVSRAELVEQKTAEYLLSIEGGVPVMHGLWALLDEIEALGLPWAVATSTPRAVATIVLQKLGVAGRYHALACGDEVENGKPAPDIFLLAAERVGADPAACLALEDSAAGCAAAAAAGMRVAAVGEGAMAAVDEGTGHEAFACAFRCYASLGEVAADLNALLAGGSS